MGALDPCPSRGGNEIDPDDRATLESEMLLINGNTAIVEVSPSIPDLELIDVRAGSESTRPLGSRL